MLAQICAFCYMDLPPQWVARLAKGPVPLADVCQSLLAQPPCGELTPFSHSALTDLQRCSHSLIGYINKNATTGFAACALWGEDTVILAMRGSESGECAASPVDWADNIAAPFIGSVQYQDIYRMVDRYLKGQLIITGHSKGGHNALYALAAAQNPEARAIVFNAQGFARTQLSRAQKARLKQHAVNYVTCSDIVGALIYHPETRMFCAARPDENPHALSSYLWNSDGEPIAAERTLGSRAIEFTSRVLISGLRNLQWNDTIGPKISV